ncbi:MULTISPECIES: hypothetical protein [Proteiniphilum]|jgi:hypothetical protein|uniref:hypothetical protein n=1 Tax=Proteiniphilum TaxID=294702 RepID=UPI001EEC65C3|nr:MULTISPECIES: hypothetical protein [Proteiniphilum]ULB34099.1 hypothetical protein KDN43_14160 [Proteiniphilum propionicum]
MDRQLPLESAISGDFNLSLGLNIDNHTDKGNRQSANNNAAPKINLTLERLINQGISLVYALNNLIRFSREYPNKCVNSNRRVLTGSFAWAQGGLEAAVPILGNVNAGQAYSPAGVTKLKARLAIRMIDLSLTTAIVR